MRIGFLWLHALAGSIIENPLVPFPLLLRRGVLEERPDLMGDIVTGLKSDLGGLADCDSA
jgi:hypothetical protein